MKVISADHDRRYDIPGAPGPARRPVEIDASNTGFTRLRSLRLYRFEAGSVIDGHAEEDELFVVVTSGTAEIKIGWENSAVGAAGVHTLKAPASTGAEPFVVYLPPQSVYQLTPHTAADVAYARATPVETRSPAVFRADANATSTGMTVLVEERAHAERLRLKVARIHAGIESIILHLPEDADGNFEALVHVQGSPAEEVGSVSADGGSQLRLRSWDTLVFHPGESAVLHTAPGAELLLLTVLAA